MSLDVDRPGAGARTGRLDARTVLRAEPTLARFNAAGVLTAADVHVAQRLGRLTGETDATVLLAVALAVRGVRAGSVCIDLDDLGTLTAPEVEDAPDVDLPWPDPQAWWAALDRSPLVACGVDGPDDRPVRWVGGRLYLDRYWRDEQTVRHEVDARLHGPSPDVDPTAVAAAAHRLWPRTDDDRQRLAAATTALGRFTVLTGGPGTGKTTTVARVLALLQQVTGPDLRIALAAPTGKAAARLQEAVRGQVDRLPEEDRARLGTLDATTVHRLLGWRSATRFRHDRTHRLPHDVVVVDETSMVSLPLMARLLEALRPEARLLLVGDPDQLASVEAGAVLGDLVQRPPVADGLPARVQQAVPDDVPAEQQDLDALRNGVVRLTTTHRYGAELDALAGAIRSGDPDAVLAVLRAGTSAVRFVETEGLPTDADVGDVRVDVVTTGVALIRAGLAGDDRGALGALESHRLLLAHRHGPAGVSHWAERAETWIRQAWADRASSGRGSSDHASSGQASSGAASSASAPGEDLTGPWPPGLPLLVTTNDRDTGLYNGDTGVVLRDTDGSTVVTFGDPDHPRRVRPHRLPSVQPVHAMTVHRGQGSQFSTVSVVLPPEGSPLLTRELLYTAVTRARRVVRILGSEAAIRAAVTTPVRRASGLRDPLA